jgi:4a-hydroxytetrahydrobiopterin dehydratase
MRYTAVSADEFAALEGLDDWRYVLGALHATFRAGSFAAAAALAGEIAQLADAADHHPGIDLRYPDIVHVTATTHVLAGTSTHDVDLARLVSGLAREAGARSEPLAAQAFEVAIDTPDADRIRPFWAAVLGYREVNGMLVDPRRIGPPVWFQRTTDVRTERGRFHLDVTVPHDEAPARLEAALAAGGRLVTDRFARSWWVLADADGNEVCICTWQDRSPRT